MKIKRSIIIFFIILVSVFILGFSGIITLADPDKNGESQYSETRDRLVGVYVTTKYLNLSDRIYAVIEEKSITNKITGEEIVVEDYAFEGIDGFLYIYLLNTENNNTYRLAVNDNTISDRHSGLAVTDSVKTISLEGTIYSSVDFPIDIFYANPVYQTATGDIYMISGNGISLGEQYLSGIIGSLDLKEEISSTIDGETKTESTLVKINFQYVNHPREITVIQLDNNNRVISSEGFAPGSLPEIFTIAPEIEYILVETDNESADGSIIRDREIYQKDDDGIETFFCRNDGICIKQWTRIIWSIDS